MANPFIAILVSSLLALPHSNEDAAGPRVLSGGHFKVKELRDIPYYTGADAHPTKHKLDLYLPEGHSNFPVVLFVHGGAWRSGDKQALLNIYGEFGRTLARNGIGAVISNYRLSPAVKHPAQIKDVAKAFAWTARNIAHYGGNVDQLYLCGHSAGGHLVSLLATDEIYLKAENISPAAIKGVIPISGVYLVEGESPLFDTIFGTDSTMRRNASPLRHVREHLPPFLVIYAAADFHFLDEMAIGFVKALQEKQDEAKLLEIKDRNHITIMGRIWRQDDEALQAVLGFIAEHGGLKLAPEPVAKP